MNKHWCPNGCGKCVRFVRYGGFKNLLERYRCCRCEQFFAKKDLEV